MAHRYPALLNLYHVPNEGKRSRAAGAQLRAAGLKPGVPDLVLACPAGQYHGAYIEMKYGQNKETQDQHNWLLRLQSAGYYTAVCYTAAAAIQQLESYINLPPGGRMKEPQSGAGYPVLR